MLQAFVRAYNLLTQCSKLVFCWYSYTLSPLLYNAQRWLTIAAFSKRRERGGLNLHSKSETEEGLWGGAEVGRK